MTLKPVDARPVAELDLVALTRRLIDIDSTTYHEGAVGRELLEILAGRGWLVEMMPVEQAEESRSQSDRFNVYAGVAGQTPEIVFSTHMDTVPPYFSSSEDDEFIYGRGACDAKGIIAAQIVAAERLRDEGARVSLLFVVGEERDSAGAGVQGLAAGETDGEGETGALGLSGAWRERDSQTAGGAAEGDGSAAASNGGCGAEHAECWFD